MRVVDRETFMLVSQQDDTIVLSVQAVLTHCILLEKLVFFIRHSM